MKEALITRYRPKNFEEFKGNKGTVMGLSMQVRKEGRPHSYLFIGPSGSGKTTLARIVAKELGCEDSEFYEFNAANTRGIDTIRAIIEQARYEPLWGMVKVFLLDECHQITGAAAEALLKFLEDPPRHVYIILCTTEPQKLLQTVKTRCSMWPVSALSESQTIELLNWVLKQEKSTQDPEVIESVAVVSEGCPRKALNILDKISGVPDKLAQLKIILDSSVDETSLELLGDMLLSKEKTWEQVVPLIEKLMKSEDEGDESNHLQVKEREVKKKDSKDKPAQPKMTQEEAESFRFKMLSFFMWKLLNKYRDPVLALPATRERIAKIMDIFSVPWYNTGKAGLVLACYKVKQI